MIGLDVTVVNVAPPSIQRDLGFSTESLAWVVNAYLIAFGGLLLLSGRLGDLVGRRTVFLAGLAVFSIASLLCGLADSQLALVGARFLQGIGGAMTSAVILGMIVTMFPEPREQARAIGAFASVASAGGAVGLLVGGVLTQAVSWHWIFFVNVPIGIATAVLARRLLERDKGIGIRQGADVPGAMLVTAALIANAAGFSRDASTGPPITGTRRRELAERAPERPTYAAAGSSTTKMLLPSGSRSAKRSGAPGVRIGSESRSIRPMALRRACSPWTFDVSTPIAPPPGSPPMGGLSARCARDSGGATSSQHLALLAEAHVTPYLEAECFGIEGEGGVLVGDRKHRHADIRDSRRGLCGVAHVVLLRVECLSHV